MTLHYLPTAEGRQDLSADQIARELVFLAGPEDPLLLPDDDAYDLTAVELAENGIRRVSLTVAERLAAATRLLATGASVHSVCIRLGLHPDTERRWRELHRKVVSVLAALVVLAAVLGLASLTHHTRPGHYRAHHVSRVTERREKRYRD